MLKIEHLNKSFGSTQVLFDVSFSVSDRRILGLVGKNGSGKSISKQPTLMVLLMTVLLTALATRIINMLKFVLLQ